MIDCRLVKRQKRHKRIALITSKVYKLNQSISDSKLFKTCSKRFQYVIKTDLKVNYSSRLKNNIVALTQDSSQLVPRN
jgi:hypothetical protein